MVLPFYFFHLVDALKMEQSRLSYLFVSLN